MQRTSDRAELRRPGLATLAGGGAILLWASLAVLTAQVRDIPPFELLGLAFGGAASAGMVVLAIRGPTALTELRQPLGPWLLAFGGLFLFHALYFVALRSVPPAEASLVAYLWPLLIVLLSAVTAGAEPLRARHLVGALLGLTGTALLLHGKLGRPTGSAAGYAAAFGCALVWSTYSVLNRRFAAVPSGMLVGVCGAVAIAGGLLHVVAEPVTVRPQPDEWLAIATLGLGPTGLAFLAWDHATKHGHLPLLGALSYLAPVLSTLLLVAAGDTSLSASLLVATLLVAAGAIAAVSLPLRRQGR